MTSTLAMAELADGRWQAGGGELSDALEAGRIVAFGQCPIALPAEEELSFLRQEMPQRLHHKNVSYHPEENRLHGVKGDPEAASRVERILKEHSARVQAFLGGAIPGLAKGWTVGTTSFRPLQEKGRDLSAHASNELIHIDAGAYGATHGDRILRFFVNVNPAEDRVWATKGTFPQLFQRYGSAAGVQGSRLKEGPLDRLRTGMLGGLSSLVPAARMIDSSPYDRAMRRFHNFMKDTPGFQSAPEGHEELRFAPFSAWMVFTDMVSHACLSGQHAFVDTFIVPLANCRHPELAPIHILQGEAADRSLPLS